MNNQLLASFLLLLGIVVFPNNILSSPQFYPFLYHNKEKFEINPYEYRRFIRPQIKTIITEFHQMLKHINPSFVKLIDIKKILIENKAYTLKFYSNCFKGPNNDCYELLQSIHTNLKKIERRVFILQKENTLSNRKNIYTPYISDQQLTTLINFQIKNHQLINSIEVFLLSYSTPMKSYFSNNEIFKNDFHLNFLSFEFCFLSFIPILYQENHSFIYQKFIRAMELKILPKDNTTYLENNIEELNFSWNNFHMEMTKGNIKIDSKIKSLINTIHNRWNNVLKISLN